MKTLRRKLEVEKLDDRVLPSIDLGVVPPTATHLAISLDTLQQAVASVQYNPIAHTEVAMSDFLDLSRRFTPEERAIRDTVRAFVDARHEVWRNTK